MIVLYRSNIRTHIKCICNTPVKVAFTHFDSFNKCSIRSQGRLRCWSPSGSFTRDMLWSNWSPRVRISSCAGRITFSKGWLKWFSKVKNLGSSAKMPRTIETHHPCRFPRRWVSRYVKKTKNNFRIPRNLRELGSSTPSKLTLNQFPKVKLWRQLGRVKPTRLWLK